MALPETAPGSFRVPVIGPAIKQLLRQCADLRIRGNIARAMARDLMAYTEVIVQQMRDERSKRKGD
jgi:hypothetical protein